MSDIKLALDYLQDLFEKLDNRLIDPALADWVFAREAWQVVREKLQAQAGEIQELRREPQPVPQWLLDEYGVRLKTCPFCEATELQLVSLGSALTALDMSYFVQCEQCGGRGPVTLYSQEAVTGWNYASDLEMKPGSGESE